MKEEVKRYFDEKFQEAESCMPELEGIDFKLLSQVNSVFLEDPFSDIEIKESIWGVKVQKRPCPEGFNFVFIENFWDILKDDITKFVKDFHSKAKLSNAMPSTFLTFIPKCNNPQG